MIFWVPVSEFILEFVSHEEIRFPGMAGSSFRGVFGHCLRKECCVTGQQECSRCQILGVCPYNIIFERAVPADGDTVIRDDTAKPYIFETVNLSNQTSGIGERFSIRVKLFGVESSYMKYIINAMAAAGKRGVGADRRHFRLVRAVQVYANGLTTVYREKEPRFFDLRDFFMRLECPDSAGEIQVIIPENMALILKQRHSCGGKRGVAILPEDFTARKFLTTAVRRTLSLYEHYRQKKKTPVMLPFRTLPEERLRELASGIELCDAAIFPRICTRYSNRSCQKTSLTGFYGSFTLRGDLTPFLPYIWFCAVCHLGSYSIMGLGGYAVRVIR